MSVKTPVDQGNLDGYICVRYSIRNRLVRFYTVVRRDSYGSQCQTVSRSKRDVIT